MKKKFVRNDTESEEYDGNDCYFTMYELNHDLGIEVTESQKDVALFTKANPIDSIVINGIAAISQMTIFFGNYAHIHLDKNQLKTFVEGINKVYKNITFSKYSVKCDKCKFQKTYKPKKRFLLDDKIKDKCPKCGKKINGIQIEW